MDATPEARDLEPARASIRRRVPMFWIGFAVVALARTLVALSRVDALRGEELYQGSLAWALIQGFPLDRENLPVIVHLRGSFVFGVLAAPLYGLLGPLYVVLKLVAIAWSGLAGGLLAFAVERGLPGELLPRARRRAAWTAVALAALFPPAYQMVDASAYGSHMDSVVPPLAALCLIVARRGPLGFARALGVGLCLGFGAFFSLQCVVATPAVILAWWGADRGLWRRLPSLGVLAAALPAAAIPLISRSSTLVTKSMSDHLLPEGPGGALDKLGAWFSGDGVRVLLFEVHGGAWGGFVFAAAGVAALVLLLPRLMRLEPLALFAAAHPLLVFGAWVASDFELNLDVLLNGMGSRYLMPTMPALAVALVLGAHTLRRATPWLGRALLLTALLPGALGYASLLDTRPLFALPTRSGTHFAFFEVHFRHAGGWRERLELAREVDPSWDAYRPVSYGALAPDAVAQGAAGPPDLAAWKAVGEIDPELRPYALAALGARALGTPGPGGLKRALAAIPPAVGAEDARWYRRGVGRSMMFGGLAISSQSGAKADAVFHVLGALEGAEAEDVWLGAGLKLGQLFTPYNENLARPLDAAERVLTGPARDAFFRGVALGWRLRFVEATWSLPEEGAPKIERLLGADARAAFRRGLEADLDGEGAWGRAAAGSAAR